MQAAPQFHDFTPRQTLVALVQDRPGVLNRAVSLFRRRGMNIAELRVAPTARMGISRMTWIVESGDVDGVLRQLDKLIEVLDVYRAEESHGPDGAVEAERRLASILPAEAQADGVP
ncbi:MAG TPA: acetolactate synthase small subunit [Gemmatimonadaceae bacterium]|nr:acetolactate synthase small subunit [Gemmatimonadaceae bacterium]